MKIRGAVIGCGRMGAFTSESVLRFSPRCWFPLSHAEAIRRHPQLELAALCDPDPLPLERAASLHSVRATFSDHRALIESIRPQLLGIATRTVGRADIIRFAAENGVTAMHIEKPLCNSVRELEALSRIFANPTLYCTYGAIRRHFAIYREARRLADSGAYGPLREIRVNLGEGMLYWTHPHSVDLILYFAGDRALAGVQARLGNVAVGRTGAEILTDPTVECASIHFVDGVCGHITRAPGCNVIISCRDAEISVEGDGRAIFLCERRGEDPYLHREPYVGAYGVPDAEGTSAPVGQLANCLDGSVPCRVENAALKAQILLGQAILFAMVQSHAEGSRIVGEREVDPDMAILAQTGGKFA